MKKLLVCAAVVTLSFASPAMAGDVKFSNADGFQLHIKCTGSGCRVRGKEPGGKWGNVERTAGGSKNFEALVEKYEAMGFTQS